MGKPSIEEQLKNIKKYKMLLNIIIVIFLVFAVASFIKIKDKEVAGETEQQPTGGLSQSIFAYQNNEYETVIGMDKIFYLNNGHYAYDMYDVNVAIMGNSSFYKVSSDVNVGVTNIDKDNGEPLDRLFEDIRSGFGVSDFTETSREKGYRNGWAVTYISFEGLDYNEEQLKGVAYIAKTEEGYFIISAFSSQVEYKEISDFCIKVYDSVRVSDEWIKYNETETPKMFVPKESSAEQNN